MKLTKNIWSGTGLKVGVSLAGLLFAGAAAADSITTYSALECKNGSYNGNQGGAFEGQWWFGGSTDCPLVRNSSDAAGSIANVVVRVNDGSTTGKVSCWATSCNGQGDTCYISGTSSTTNAFTGATYVTPGTVSTHSTGYAYVTCTFPSGANSAIYSYRATD